MTIQEILLIIDAITKLLAALQGIGVNLSNVQMKTTNPLDLSTLFSLIQPPK